MNMPRDSNIVLLNSSDQISRMGLIAKKLTEENETLQMTDADTNKKGFSLQLVIPNPRSFVRSAMVSIYVTDKHIPTIVDLYTEATIAPGATFIWGDMRLSNSEKVFVWCDMSGVPVRVEGYADGSK